MQPIWKLYGNGSVGSQALLGIPHLMSLRSDAVLAPVSRVWPFETGLRELPGRDERSYLVVHAEIYPSLLVNEPGGGEVKDALQVRTMARHFAALDDASELSTLFAGPTQTTKDERERIESEEGWTLGVLSNVKPPVRLVLPSITELRQPASVINELPERAVAADLHGAEPGQTGLPKCDFVYFASPTRGSWTMTAEFVETAKAIVAHAYNSLGLRMPLIQHLRPGHQILLTYGDSGKYSPIFRCEVCASPEPVSTRKHTFDVLCYIADRFHDQLREEGYGPDPEIQRFTGISIGAVEDLRNCRFTITKPRGNNTLRRWDEVFPSGEKHKSG
jgi:hypothetical protein